MATDFLKDVNEDNFVFIKTMPKKDEDVTMLYFKQKKDIPDVATFTLAPDCENDDNENKTLLEVFTVDKDKYNLACQNATIKKPLNIDAVAGDNQKACYIVDNTVFGLIAQFPVDTNSIIIGKSSLNIKFDKDNLVSEVTIKNLSTVNEEQQEELQDTEKLEESEDVKKKNNLEEFSTLLDEESASNENVKDGNKKDKIKSSFESMDLNSQTALLEKLSKPTTQDQEQLTNKKNAIYDLLEAENINQEQINKEVQQLGGKATRRRKRRGKKRSKNTRKKRKSKKARKSKR